MLIEQEPYMTNNELRSRFRMMDRSNDRYQVLADLNGCGRWRIQAIIEKHHGAEHKLKVLFDEEKAFILYGLNCTDLTIATTLGTFSHTICRWRKKVGLAAKRKRGQPYLTQDPEAAEVIAQMKRGES